jgi:methenyltetrahydrofolate cyclohydrolase
VTTLTEYLDALASADPTPGGGSAAALVGATGAALIAMTARIALRSKRLSDVHPEAERIAAHADALRAAFDQAGIADEHAYGGVVRAYGMPKDSQEERDARRAALAQALVHAAEAPLEIARIGAEVARLAETTLTLRNTALFSDVLCGAEFAVACVHAAAANVRINHRSMQDESVIIAQSETLNRYIEDAESAREIIRSVES